MTQRTKERWGGLGLFALGVGSTAYNWYQIIHHGHFYAKMSVYGPAFAVIGLGALLFPSYRSERLARGEDPRNLPGYRVITRRWWIILAIGLAVGFLNRYCIG
jgi:hypothetical protein